MRNARYKTVHEQLGVKAVEDGRGHFLPNDLECVLASGCHYNEDTGEVSDLDPSHRDWSDNEIGEQKEAFIIYGDMEIPICDRCGRFVLDEDGLCTGECFVDAEDRKHLPAPYHL